MATMEERLQIMIGQQAFALASLGAQLEQAQAEVAKLKEGLQRGAKANGNGAAMFKETVAAPPEG